MDFHRIAMDIVDLIRSGCTWRGFKWRRGSDTKDDPDCAVFHMDIDVKPGTIFSLTIMFGLLRFFSKPESRPDLEHPFFEYLKQESTKGVDAQVRIVVRLEPRPAQPEAEMMPPEGEIIHTTEQENSQRPGEGG